MYSEKITERRFAQFYDDTGIKLVKFTIDESRAWTKQLADAYNKEGEPTRDFTADEKAFIVNEFTVCKFDFRYWHDRYCYMIRDSNTGPGGTGTAKLWQSQELLIRRMGEAEERNWDLIDQGHPSPGIKIADHKARQLGHTQVARAITMHRGTLWTSMRAIAASIDDDKTGELYDRDERILFNLPPWLRPPLIPKKTFFSNRNENMIFKENDSNIIYQQSTQMSGLGQGRQFETAHLTECGAWPNWNTVENDFFPTIEHPKNVTILESTAQGRIHPWMDFTESVRRGDVYGWVYHFTPWYVEKGKYRAAPPPDWSPSELSLQHARKCRETSPEFCFGVTMEPDREQLYWYEVNRESARKKNSLNWFLANYASTPEESFQHSGRSAFPVELLEKLDLGCVNGTAYEVNIGGRIL